MRNVCRLIELSDSLPCEIGQYTLFTVDTINSVVYLVTDSNTFVGYSTTLKNVKVQIELNQQDILSEGAKIVAVQFIPDQESVCLASTKGDILMFNVQSGQLECVGIVGSGIMCMSWSPDFELFILATESETLVQMTKDWDILGEVGIHSLLPGGKLTANIITNSNLPQSQYSKAAYAPSTMDPTQAATTTSTKDDSVTTTNNRYLTEPPSISWRGDGQFFVCSSFDASCNRVMLRTWERALVLHAISEPLITGLDSGVAWRPSGSLIACSNHLPNKHEIAFFERNGLKHGEFTIRSPNTKVRAIEWSSDSELLALQLELEGGSSVVQVWHRSNYYWFLKHEFTYAQGDKVARIAFDTTSIASTLRVVTALGQFHEHQFAWDYNYSLGEDADNPTTVVMIDGAQLKMTPFRRLVVPPPMSAFQVQLSGSCSAFDFRQDYAIVVITGNNNSIAIYTPATLPTLSPVPSSAPVLPNYSVAPTLTAQGAVPTADIRLSHLRHLTCVPGNSGLILVAVDGLSAAQDTIVEITLKQDGASLSIAHMHRTVAPGRVMRLIKQLGNNETVLFETADGAVYHYHLQRSFATPDTIAPYIDHQSDSAMLFRFPTPCHWFSATKIANEECLIGMSDRNKLYLNNVVLASDCNSYALHNKYLLYTTVSHVLRSIPLTVPLAVATSLLNSPVLQSVNAQQLNQQQQPQQARGASGNTGGPNKAPTTYDDSVRDVERGSRIVAVVPHDTRVVLQMPRGNLEAIAPRSLTLSTIRELLNAHQYGHAFGVMRRNRIDMNFIYDHNPTDFIKNIGLFVELVTQIDYLNLFITSLRDEDTSKTLFIDLENPPPPPLKTVSGVAKTLAETAGKVNLVCDCLRKEFIARGEAHYIQPILTTYVKKSPPELDEVLRLIQTLRGRQETNEHGETVVNRLAEESLDYIVFLVDVNKLYNIALGTYDFDLVLMVAQKSQKDPKEYIAFLQELQSMEKYYQRYMIDKYLERWPKALANLASAGPDHLDECFELMVQKSLYHDGLKVFAQRPDELKRVQELYGDSLMQNNKFEDASYLYYSAANYQKALAAFKDAGRWRMALIQARLLAYTPEDTQQLCHDMADSLRRSSNYCDAAALYLEQCHDLDNALHSLCEGGLWVDAINMAKEQMRNDLIDSIVAPLLLDAFNNNMKELEENHETYLKHYTRLGVVRTTKLNYVPLRMLGGPGSQFNDETGSMMSGMSGMFSEQSMGSMNSGSTTLSYRSTYSSATGTFSQATKLRNKKKDASKRKVNKVRVTGKEGSQYEEEFIVEAMRKMIPTSSQQQVVGQVLRGLVLLSWADKAETLQTLYKQYLELVAQSLELLSHSATAIQPDNIKEQQRIQELEYAQLNNNNNNQNNTTTTTTATTTTTQPNVMEKMTINKINVTMESTKWQLDIF
ncbi:hypothetical protein SAMD00019534_015840 [Acytostelium subglobosum LB1]|uniref:hypothetical protein n=1 Tax=Acytostelium subglobosum LB1 TaxID=1410327 RepID=UPI000644D456|nr:hypothetical protein SAMD00019534_015840 [Acytostelium subglobosum LB1]GAM18409.1 hypothetical protein SAMD00019534_015840 [Acytostelium subglobosum LB1]|eukprot:XP_012757629.1 hypothetical protein SAMD00019534_015840 [Acytostelium subglobosum LB1]